MFSQGLRRCRDWVTLTLDIERELPVFWVCLSQVWKRLGFSFLLCFSLLSAGVFGHLIWNCLLLRAMRWEIVLPGQDASPLVVACSACPAPGGRRGCDAVFQGMLFTLVWWFWVWHWLTMRGWELVSTGSCLATAIQHRPNRHWRPRGRRPPWQCSG